MKHETQQTNPNSFEMEMNMNVCVHICVTVVSVLKYYQPASAFRSCISSQHRELISLLLQPHLQQALDRPTTTSRPLRSALRRASRISSVMKERADLLNTPSWLFLVGVKLKSLFLWRRFSTAKLEFKPSKDSSWWELNGSSETSAGEKIKLANQILDNLYCCLFGEKYRIENIEWILKL